MAQILVLFILTCFANDNSTDFSTAQWEAHGNYDGIALFRWNPPNSDILAFKAEGIVEALPAKVGAILVDVTRHVDWMPDLGHARTIQTLSPSSRIDYSHLNTPFIIKDRDFVYKGEAHFEKAEQKLTLKFYSIEDPSVPKTKYVRGHIHASHYSIWPIEGGKKTFLTFVFHVDPKGTVPKWLVNMFQKKFPREMFENIRRQAKKDDLKDDPAITKLFEPPRAIATP